MSGHHWQISIAVVLTWKHRALGENEGAETARCWLLTLQQAIASEPQHYTPSGDSRGRTCQNAERKRLERGALTRLGTGTSRDFSARAVAHDLTRGAFAAKESSTCSSHHTVCTPRQKEGRRLRAAATTVHCAACPNTNAAQRPPRVPHPRRRGGSFFLQAKEKPRRDAGSKEAVCPCPRGLAPCPQS